MCIINIFIELYYIYFIENKVNKVQDNIKDTKFKWNNYDLCKCPIFTS